jgi:3(or 17)beta-hydroxysteroid dehydrogenase
MRLKGKVALVTGAGSGLGRAITHRFVEEGAVVVATDVDVDGVQNTANLSQDPSRVIVKRQDVTVESEWMSVTDGVIADFGALDILVNNAGIVHTASIEDETLEGWRRTQAVNLDGVFMGTQAGIKVMKQNGGSIINLSSIEGIIGEASTAAYNASKGGVRIMTKSAALWCCQQNYGIRINSIHPGFIETPMVLNALALMPEVDRLAMEAKLGMAIPMGQMGEPRDIANAALFLATEESRYMTGSELVVDGGYTAQ